MNPEQRCPSCGEPMKLVPAGVSKKTNRPYNAFYSCKCGKTVNPPRNPISTNQNYPAPQEYQTPETITRQEFIAFANNVKTTIQKLSDKVHALEMVKMYQDVSR